MATDTVLSIEPITVLPESCAGCVQGDHRDHNLRQVFHEGVYVGDRFNCECVHNGRRKRGRRRAPREDLVTRLHRRFGFTRASLILWGAVLFVGGAAVIGYRLAFAPF